MSRWSRCLVLGLPLLVGCGAFREVREPGSGPAGRPVGASVFGDRAAPVAEKSAAAVAPPVSTGHWDAAQILIAAGAFDQALVRLDSLAPQHPDHLRAAELARALEERLQESQERLLAGLVFRGQWRDLEALQCFAEARELWSGAPVDALIAATRARLALGVQPDLTMDSGRGSMESIGVGVARTVPVAVTGETSEGSEDTDGVAVAKPNERVVDHLPPGVAALEIPKASRVTQPQSHPEKEPEPLTEVATRVLLRDAQRLLEAGDLGAVVRTLTEGARRTHGDARVRKLLGDVLSQRALIAYGRGGLEAAVRDWRRVMEIHPGRRAVEASLRAAETELKHRQMPCAARR